MCAESKKAMIRPSLCVSILASFILPVAARAQASQQNPSVDTKVRVLRSYSGTEALPRPESIAIFNFVVPADVVTMDESVAGRLQQRRSLRKGVDETSPEAVAAHVQSTFSKELVQALQKSPIPVGRAATGSDIPNHTLEIRGEFTGVEEGNATKRIMVGFGRGASSVRACVNLTLIADAKLVMVSEFQLNFASGKKPGAAATMGVGSLAVGAAAGGMTDKRSTVDADVARMAKAVAKQISAILSAQQWIPSPQSAADAKPAAQ
jgi:hypothetical protein